MKKEICTSFSDRELVELSVEQLNYFECLYLRYENSLLRYIHRISNCSEEEAYDILQESFIKIWKNLNDFDPELSFSTWAYRIVYHHTISHWRKSVSFGKNKTVAIEGQPLTSDENYSTDHDDKVLQIIHLLPEKYQMVLILKYFEDKNYIEISDIMKIPEGTVATYLNRAKKEFLKISQQLKINFFE